ncbi:MAG: hypothetical protein F7C35_06785 [Desulfurococcales archaeon]|nr:hypothetical protein [Desulfurococcales archaeon]
MNWKKTIFAALLIALMVAAYAPSMPAKAAGQGVVVLTQTVSANNWIYFFINLTYLRDTFGWIGSTADIYLSNNGYSSLNPGVDDLALETGIYVAGKDYIAGMLYINWSAASYLLGGNDSGYLYLKFFDGNYAHIAVSNRFYVVLNVSKVFEHVDYNLSMTGYSDSTITTSNTEYLKMNLTGIVDPTFNLSSYDISVTLISTTNPLYQLSLYKRVWVNSTTVNETSDVLNLTSTNVTNTTLTVNGSLKNFALEELNSNMTVMGLIISYEEFSFALQALSQPVNLSGNIVWINHAPSTVLENVTVNIGSINETINIFPSVEVVGFTQNATTNTTEINPNDYVTVHVYNFNGSNTTATTVDMVVCFFSYDRGVRIVNTAPVTVSLVHGNATFTVMLPEGQYGGDQVWLAVREITSSGMYRGLPGTNSTVLLGPSLFRVHPYLDIAFVTNDGNFTSFYGEYRTAPGDYVLVKGHGFIAENISVYTVSSSTKVDELIPLLDSDGDNVITVNSKGMFFTILKIPADADITASPFKFVAEGVLTDHPNNFGFSTDATTFTYDLADNAVAKVFVNPMPIWKSGFDANNTATWDSTYAYVYQDTVSPAYPHDVPWLDQLTGESEFTVEVIGVNFTTADIALTNSLIPYAPVTVVAGVSITNGYYKSNVYVPIAPYGGYNVTAFDSTNYAVNVSTYKKMVFVEHTERIKYTAGSTTLYLTSLYLDTAQDIIVEGYGWPSSGTVSWTFSKVGSLVTPLAGTFTTYPNGTFNETFMVSSYLTDNGPGVYKLELTYNSTITAVFYIYYKTLPNVTIEVHTGTLKLVYPGDVVDVYVVVYLGSQLAKPSDFNYIHVYISVYYYDGSAVNKLIDNDEATYSGHEGIWHYRFAVPVTVEGDDLLVKAYVNASITNNITNTSVKREAVAFTSLTVDHSILALFNATLEAIENNSEMLNETINTFYNNLIHAIQSGEANLTDLINMTRTLILNAIENNATQILGLIQNKFNSLNLTIEEIDGKLMVVSDTLNETYADVGALMALANTINANITLLTTETLYLEGLINASTSEVLNSTGQLYLALTMYGDNILYNQYLILVGLNATLDKLDALLTKVDNNTAILLTKLGLVEANLSEMIDELNMSITGAIADSTGNILFVINTSKGEILATINATADMLEYNITMAKNEVINSILALGSSLNTTATQILTDLGIIKGNLTKLDKIMGLINGTKSSLMNEINGAVDTVSTKIDNAQLKINNNVNNTANKVIGEINKLNSTLTNATSSITDLINGKANEISGKISDLQTALSQKIDSSISSLNQTLSESNNAVKSRVTTMTSLSTVVLLAAIIGIGFALTRRPT